MHEERRRARRGECCRHLLADMAGFADASDDHPAPCRRQDFDRLSEWLTHAIGQGRPDRGNPVAFKVERAQSRRDRSIARLG